MWKLKKKKKKQKKEKGSNNNTVYFFQDMTSSREANTGGWMLDKRILDNSSQDANTVFPRGLADRVFTNS